MTGPVLKSASRAVSDTVRTRLSLEMSRILNQQLFLACSRGIMPEESKATANWILRSAAGATLRARMPSTLFSLITWRQTFRALLFQKASLHTRFNGGLAASPFELFAALRQGVRFLPSRNTFSLPASLRRVSNRCA